jgi:hypothetical protein
MISVVRNIEPDCGWSIYRARRVSGEREFSKFFANGASELGPPPPEFATAGRMNAEGVPVFYGSSDRETCVSELRPQIGSMVATAEFRLTRRVTVLDFRVLENCFGESSLSIFAADYQHESERRRFLMKLHRMVREPIQSGDEKLYLKTQVLAEYLAGQHEPPIEGVLFSSSQRSEGSNLVLFPTKTRSTRSIEDDIDGDFLSQTQVFPALHEPSVISKKLSLSQFPLEFVTQSLVLHEVQKISHSFRKIETSDGHISHDWDDLDDDN